MARVLLIEVVAVGRFFTAATFPFLKGLLAARQIPVRWLRFGVAPDMRFERDDDGYGLGAEDLPVLAAALRAEEWTHVAFGATPGAAVVALVRGERPEAQLAVLDEDGAGPAEDAAAAAPVPRVPLTFAALSAWLGLPVPPSAAGRRLQDVVDPDFAYEPANERLRGTPPVVHVFAGAECTHRRRLAESVFFAAHRLPGLPSHSGCTFCTVAGAAPGAERRAEVVAQLRRLLACAARTHPPGAEPICYRLHGAGASTDPLLLADAVLEVAPPPGRFLVDYRADQVVRRAAEIEQAARRLGAAGHRLEVCLVGVESFSARQLDRYLKGYGPETNLRCVRILRELEAAVPEGFGFREYGGLSTILYDPWTTLADIALNLAVVRFFRLERLCGKLLTSRLRLVPGTPLEDAARADGLLVDRYRDPQLDTARLNFYEDELPWRAADARVEALVRVLVRLPREARRAGDPIGAALDADDAAAGQTEGGAPVERARRMVALAATSHDPLAPQVLIGGSRAAAPSAGAAALSRDPDLGALRRGRIRVAKLEDYGSAAEGAAREAWLRRRWPGIVTRLRAPRDHAGRDFELFAGWSAADVAEAVATTDAIETEVDGPRQAAAVRHMGELLGYPSCCTAAFAAAAKHYWTANEWLWVKRRLEGPERYEAAFVPGMTSHVPCTTTCERTAALVGPRAPGWWRRLAAWRRRHEVIVMLLDRPGEWITLRSAEAPQEELRYRVSGWRTGDPRLAAVQAGETLVIEPGLLRIRRGRRELAYFALDAFPWWPGGVFHRAFWEACLEELERPLPEPEAPVVAAEPPTPEGTVPESPGEGPETNLVRQRLRAQLLELLAELAARGDPRLAGFRCEEIAESTSGADWGELVVRLRRGAEELRLYIQARVEGAPSFCRTERFTLLFDPATPPDDDDKRRVMTSLLEAFERRASA